jgi:hypothetical protein
MSVGKTELKRQAERKLRRSLCRKNDIRKSIRVLTQLFCEIGEELAIKSEVKFPSENFSHMLLHLKR